MNTTYRILAIALLIIAIIQWLGIGERIYHGLWQWYKFYGYSNDGHTTVSNIMALVTFVLSALAIAGAYFISSKSTDSFSTIIAKYSGYSLALGVVSLSILLISPIGQLVQR